MKFRTYRAFNKQFAIFALILLMVSVIFVQNAAADNDNDDWELKIKVTAGVAKNKLSFGQKTDATDGIDGRYEVPAMLSGVLKASFMSSGKQLWRDIRALDGETKVWTMKIDSTHMNKNVTIQWSLSSLPADRNLYLTDKKTGKTISMASKSSYTFRYDGIREIALKVLSTGEVEELLEDDDYNDSDRFVGFNDDDSSMLLGSLEGENLVEDSSQLRKASIFKMHKEIEKNRPSEVEAYVPSNAVLVKPNNIEGFLSDKEGLYIKWHDMSSGDYGFVVENMCGVEEGWSAVAALWGVSPEYENKSATLKKEKSCKYRIVALDFPNESEYSDVVTFDDGGEIWALKELPAQDNLEENKVKEN